MTDQDTRKEELEEENGELLPDREALSVVNPLGDDFALELPKELDREPGLPPPRD